MFWKNNSFLPIVILAFKGFFPASIIIIKQKCYFWKFCTIILMFDGQKKFPGHMVNFINEVY